MSETLTVSEKDLLSQKLSDEIDEKKTFISNLDSQIITLERQNKAEHNVGEAKYQETRNRALRELSDQKGAVSKEKAEWHRKNERLNEQRQMLEKNEKAVGLVKEQMTKLNGERREIYAFRKEAQEIMRKAKEEWGEIRGFKQSQEAMKQNLESQIKNNEDKNKYLMDSIGEVEARVKAVSIRESNCKALEMVHDKKEETNGN